MSDPNNPLPSSSAPVRRGKIAAILRLPALPVVLCILVYLGFQSQYLFATPFISGPDEPDHMAYLVSVATQFQIPAMGETRYLPGKPVISLEAQQPPFYYLFVSPLYLMLAHFGRQAIWVGLRAFSALCGVAIIWLCWLTASTVWGKGRVPAYGMVAALALLPTFGYSTSTINNEPLAAAFGAATFYLVSRVLAGKSNDRTLLLLGVSLGLGALTKMTTLAWWPAAAVGLILAGRRLAWSKAEWKRCAALVALPALIIPAGWWIRSLYFYQTVAPRSVERPLYHVSFTAKEWMEAVHALMALAITGSYVPYFLIGPLVQPVLLLFGLGVVSIILLIGIARWSARPHSDLNPSAGPLAAVAAVALIACWLALIQQILFVDVWVALYVGRYVFTYLPAAAYLISIAIGGLLGGSRRAIAGYAVLSAIWIGLTFMCLTLIRAFFELAPPPKILIP